jgi:hypothetical protein
MDVELLVVTDCAHAGPATELLRTALDDIGLIGLPFTTTVVDTHERARNRGFLGSPTIMANGSDLFPERGRPAALACRLYRHPDGSSGLPDLRELRRALKQAAEAVRVGP